MQLNTVYFINLYLELDEVVISWASVLVEGGVLEQARRARHQVAYQWIRNVHRRLCQQEPRQLPVCDRLDLRRSVTVFCMGPDCHFRSRNFYCLSRPGLAQPSAVLRYG